MFTFDESSLVFGDDYRKNCFDFVGYYFCEDFIACIAEGDWPKYVEVDCSFFLSKSTLGRTNSFHLLVFYKFEIFG